MYLCSMLSRPTTLVPSSRCSPRERAASSYSVRRMAIGNSPLFVIVLIFEFVSVFVFVFLVSVFPSVFVFVFAFAFCFF